MSSGDLGSKHGFHMKKRSPHVCMCPLAASQLGKEREKLIQNLGRADVVGSERGHALIIFEGPLFLAVPPWKVLANNAQI